jgi:hypothetical protein
MLEDNKLCYSEKHGIKVWSTLTFDSSQGLPLPLLLGCLRQQSGCMQKANDEVELYLDESRACQLTGQIGMI